MFERKGLFGSSLLARTYPVIEGKGLFAHRVLVGSPRSSGDCSVTVWWWLAVASEDMFDRDGLCGYVQPKFGSVRFILPLIDCKGL